MKRIPVLLLLLCLVLAGCGAISPTEPLPSVSLPTIHRETEPFPSAADPDPEPFPCLIRSDDGIWEILGPAGIVTAFPYPDGGCSDPVYGDVDGDGAVELVYWRPGRVPDVPVITLCVYGLEEDWPVLEAASDWQLPSGQPRLTRDPETGAFFLVLESESPIPEMTKWYSVSVEGLRVLLISQDPGGEEVPLVWDSSSRIGSALGAFGSSFSALRERFGDKALLDSSSCLVWQQTAVRVMDIDLAGNPLALICAAVTENGVTVSGALRFGKEKTGVSCVFREGLEPIPPVEDPAALAGLTAEELTERLGPCHFTMENSVGLYIPCWFTEDGKVLTVTVQDTAADASLWDMCAGLPDPEDGAATVFVHQEERVTRLENELLWKSFLAGVELGEECEVNLRMIYETGDWDLVLRWDGEVFTLTDGENVSTYRYLVAAEEDDPPGAEGFRCAVHYLLSDDPDLTWEAYLARMFSSAAPPSDFPATSLFTIYE